MENIFLSTYKIRVKNTRVDGYNIMGQFNGKDDILPVIAEYLNDIFTTPVRVNNDDEDRSTMLNLTLKEPPIVLTSERIIYGYFDAGVSGQDITVKDRHSKITVFEGDRDNHGLYRYIFFYMKLPYKSDSGYLILQRKARFGIKSAFTYLLKKWFQQRGYQDTVINIGAVLSGQIFNKMLSLGSLKKVNFIVNYIPSDITEFVNNNENPSLKEGSTITTIQSKNGLSDSWVNFAKIQYLKENKRTLVEFEEEEKEYDEIQFEVEYRGRKKTFYANRRDRTVPDLDVTAEVIKDPKTGEPYLNSLLDKCAEIIEDTFEIKPNV